MSWLFNEPWRNGAGNNVVDYDGRPLMNYFFARQALTPVALSLRYDSLLYEAGKESDIELFLTSDAPQTATGLRWKWLVRDRRGEVCGRADGVATIAPLEVQSLGKIRWTSPKDTARGPLFVELRLEDSAGTCLAERLHVFAQEGIPGPFAGLLENHGKDANENDPKTNENGIGHPVRRTTVEASVKACQEEGGQDVLALQVRNTGAMTVLFCEPHPLMSYRTDLFIENNYCFIPPGESRTITIRSDRNAACGLTLAQTGWKVSCWNVDDVVIEPDESVLLAVGRRDQMCREFQGYFPQDSAKGVRKAAFEGTHPDASQLFYLADGKNSARFEFPISNAQVNRGARLRIHTADQSKYVYTQVQVTVNGTSFEQALPPGIGLQRTDPSHLAFPSTLTFDIPSGLLQSGKNAIHVRVKNEGWFTWDALELVTKEIKTLDEACVWFEGRLPQMIKECRRTMKDSTAAYPPQVGGGYEAFWLRDYAYILEGAATLIPREELLAAAKLFVNAVSKEGAGVDCVKFD
ncbi:MAG: polysaccharide lyase family protein, partial [Lentisphaerota bacterium]